MAPTLTTSDKVLVGPQPPLVLRDEIRLLFGLLNDTLGLLGRGQEADKGLLEFEGTLPDRVQCLIKTIVKCQDIAKEIRATVEIASKILGSET